MKTKMFQCPECKAKIESVRVYSQCYQVAYINENGQLTDYQGVEEVLETEAVECPECSQDIKSVVTE